MDMHSVLCQEFKRGVTQGGIYQERYSQKQKRFNKRLFSEKTKSSTNFSFSRLIEPIGGVPLTVTCEGTEKCYRLVSMTLTMVASIEAIPSSIIS